jgi:hypothetical protein
MTIEDTCKCGAKFSADEREYVTALRDQHDKWLAAHEHCRKYLLVTTTRSTPEAAE